MTQFLNFQSIANWMTFVKFNNNELLEKWNLQKDTEMQDFFFLLLDSIEVKLLSQITAKVSKHCSHYFYLISLQPN